MTREEFIPATGLNMLAAAWLQFMIHGFFSHGKNDKNDPLSVQIDEGDDWPESPMKILRGAADPTRTDAETDAPPTYINRTSHWWDASQIYGDNDESCAKLRSGVDGKLLMGDDGLLPLDPESGLDNEYGVNVTGVSGNWWVGLSILHTLFTREHNAICDQLRASYRAWTDDDLYDHARLVNAALMAKIFMTEWTPGLTAHPIAQFAAKAGWWGLVGEGVHRRFGRITRNPIISGIPGSPHQPRGGIYAITEEFVSVYRMHPMLPDVFSFRAAQDDHLLRETDFPDVAFRNSRVLEEEIGMANLIYSFATISPGALTLHNYPKFLQRLDEPDGTVLDMAATDVFRDRERGVPRYNDFRRLIRRPPIRSFEELCANPVWREQLRTVYGDDLEKVDLMVGLYAERPPKGLALSDTAYRIFVLMTSFRLEADRFFTSDYRPEVYSHEGLEWIDCNSMSSVIRRHYPELAPALRGVANPFGPWPRAVAPAAIRPPHPRHLTAER